MASKEDQTETKDQASAASGAEGEKSESGIVSKTEILAGGNEKSSPTDDAGVNNGNEDGADGARAQDDRSSRSNRRNQPSKGHQSDEERSRRVYVGNLAWEVSWQELKDLMKTTGYDVTRADIMTTPDGRSKGCGIVEFATAEGARQAVLTLKDKELMGRQIFVREDREDRNSGGGSSRNTGIGGGSGGGGGGGGSNTNNSGGNTGGSGHRFSSGEQAQSRRVYVGNLSWDVAWQDLKDHMRQAGDVVHAEVICEHNGRSKGCGIVEFSSDEEAKEAIKTLTDTELKGRMIFVREDRENSSGAATGGGQSGGSGGAVRGQNTSVYVWNLSYETTWQELKDHMRKAGNVDQATILTDPEGQSIGCGVVVYQRAHDAARAIRELQDSELKGRAMHLREDRVQSGRGHGGRGGRGRHGGRGGRGHGHGHSHSHGQGGHSSVGDGAQLFVGNLSFNTNWRDLKDHFRQCGEVERADVKYSDGKSRGFGTVRFYKSQDAEAAIQRLNGVELQGRALEVRLDQKA